MASGKRTDSASRTIRAAPQRVYRALVDPKSVAEWLPPHGMKGEIHAFDPREGGVYRMTLTYEEPGLPGKTSDHSDTVKGRFVELVPGERVVQAVEFESEDPTYAGTMTIAWSLKPAPAGTEVAIVCENVPVGISKGDHEAGLRSTLENLAAFVE